MAFSFTYTQNLAFFCLLLVPLAFLLTVLARKPVRTAFWPGPFSARALSGALLAGAGAWLVAAFLERSAVLGYPILRVPAPYPQDGWQAAGLLLIIGLLAPLCQEIAFRGALQPLLRRLGAKTGIILAALLFAAFSLGAERLFGWVTISLLGILLGALAARAADWRASALANSLVHLLTVGLYILNDLAPAQTVSLPLTSPFAALAGFILLVIGFILAGSHSPESSPTLPRPGRALRIIRPLLLAGLVTVVVGLASLLQPFAPPDSPLTARQKEAEFRYLTGLVREVYAFRDLNVNTKKLDDIYAMEASYIQRAAETPDDPAYFALFREYLTRLGPDIHAYLLDPTDSYPANWAVCYAYALDCGLLPSAYRWYLMDPDEKWKQSARSPLSLLYQEGEYRLIREARVGGQTLPIGSRVLAVDGLAVDDYVHSVQATQRLRYDPAQRKPYLYYFYDQSLLLARPRLDPEMWQVDFERPDGSRVQVWVPASPGASNGYAIYFPNTKKGPNVLTLDLAAGVGYIRVFGFHFSQSDKELLSQTLADAGARYTTLIVDLRGNDGGSPLDWMDSLVAPLLTQPVRYTETAAVRRGLIDRQHLRFWSFRVGDNHNSLLVPSWHFSSIDEITPPAGMNPADWRTFQVKREIAPTGKGYTGKLYWLIDQDCFSACSDLALMVKTSGLGVLAGVHTGGGAAVILPPQPYQLPESGITFMLEPDLAFNPDGTVNEAGGTAPDLALPARLLPANYDLATLQADPWIQAVLKNAGN